MKLVAILESKRLNTRQLALLVQQVIADHTDYELELSEYDGFIVGRVLNLSDENDRIIFLSSEKVAVCHLEDFDSIISGGPADIHWPSDNVERWANMFVKDWLY
jgi:hypothetical protein